ncbi:glucan 1,3-beta-glucosidase [Cladorrhinum sp. PSN259]|nr:glucan 1,3-beta-glucosidase [Cladorrhinum sp. PSN259]
MRASILSSTSALLAITGFLSSAHSSSSSSHLSSEALLSSRQQQCQNEPATPPSAGNPSKWWRSQIVPNGTTPYASDPSYQYYRTPIQFGADPTGVKDSSEAFNLAITSQNRTANTVTTRPAYIYVPPGRYLIANPVNLLVNTYLIGDLLSPPTLVSSPSLDTQPVINAFDPYQGEGSANKNFYVSLRNFVIDTTLVPAGVKAKAINWSVSQGCSLINVHVIMPTTTTATGLASSSEHIGVGMDPGGSGSVIADCKFKGGKVGVEVAGQQYLLKGLEFEGGTEIGIRVKRGYVLTILGGGVKGAKYGVEIEEDGVGAVSVVDFEVEGCEAGVNVMGGQKGSLVLDGVVVKDGSGIAVRRGSNGTGEVLLRGSMMGEAWVMGNTHPDGYQANKLYPIKRPAGLLDNNGKYFTKPLPQYEEYDISQVVNIKKDPEHPVYGDNIHDDGPSINAILQKHAPCNKIIFFPQGIYRTTTTIFIPPGSRLVGEVLPVITASGQFFSSESSPKPLIQVGQPNSTGTAQFTDLLFSVSDVLPGAIIVEVNMASSSSAAAQPGDVVGFWNCVIRVGGSVDTQVLPKCTGLTPCKAAFALLHLKQTASAYLEGIWGWVADHGLDPLSGSTVTPSPSTMPGQTISVGRGALIGTTKPTWLVGTSFEHATLYQYALLNASNVFLSGVQTESPYWQGKGSPERAPSPWDRRTEYGDPTFTHCKTEDEQCYRSWGMLMVNIKDVVMHGTGLWGFFNGMNDNLWRDPQCTETGGVCQTNMVWLEGVVSRLFWFSLGTKSTENMVYDGGMGGTGGQKGLSVLKQSDVPGGWGGLVAAYLRYSGEEENANDSGASVFGAKGVVVLVIAALYAFWSLM